ncbi:MAG: M1 family aminopeptidase [Pyrinomonadaceae bacterium]
MPNKARLRAVQLCGLLIAAVSSGAPWETLAALQPQTPSQRRSAAAAARRTRKKPPASKKAPASAARSSYQIHLSLDFENRSYAGLERVRWVNRDDRPASQVYLHLYPNKIVPASLRQSTAENQPATGGDHQEADLSATTTQESHEPHLRIESVRTPGEKSPLPFSLDERDTVLRVNLRETVMPGAAAEMEISFAGIVPEIEADETTLLAHVMQQINSVFRSGREARHSRDINFSCRGVLLLGASYPVLAVRSGEEWRRKTETSVGDFIFAEAADYEVTVEAAPDIRVFSSADEQQQRTGASTLVPQAPSLNRTLHAFSGSSLRDFAFIAGRSLRSEERDVGGLKVRSIYTAGRESIGRRVLAVAASAARVYTERFGPLPHKVINVAETPLVARLGAAEFSGLACIASAFYVDFDSPAMRSLPEIVREQRVSIEDSLEFTVAHVVAQQWWGAAVGNDPERTPVLDEALSNWSALLYYRDTHGGERAAVALDDQLRGVYKVYRTFGGEDMTADRQARDYRNFFQYSAIVVSKGALMFDALLKLLGEERFFAALKSYYNANMHEVAEMDDLRGAFVAEAAVDERRAVSRTFNRWLSEKRGDEDIAPPDPQLAAAVGITIDPAVISQRGGDNGNRFARLGKFFWRQMTRIR